MFYKCPGLASIKIPEGVQTIDEQAFSSCAGLKTVVLPASLTEIGLSAFENCGRISDVYFAGTQAQLNSIDVYSTEDPGTSYTMSDVFGSNVTIHCRTALKITSQPKDYSGIAGETATFKVTAKGDALSYQWQYYSKGKWVDSSELGAKTARVYADITNSRNGLKYRCVVTDIYGNTVTSQAAKIIVETPLVITKNPEDFIGPVGSTATFSVEAEGDELKYQWQYYSKGTWKNSGAAGNKTPQISVDVTSSRDGMKFRCVVTDKYGNEVISDAAVIYARTILEISKQPEDFTGPVGSKATFSIAAKGDGLKYQWQYYSGGTWKNSGTAGNKTPQITVDVTSARDGMKFRCVVTDKYGNKEISEAAAVHAKTVLEITGQPEDYTGPIGSKATFSIAAKGDGLKYQWQYCSKGVWKNSGATGNKTSQITVDITNARDGMKFRCVVTDKYGATVTSEEAAIHVANQYTTADQNEPVYLTATDIEEAEGDELTEQRQYSRNDSDWFTPNAPDSKTNTILNTDI